MYVVFLSLLLAFFVTISIIGAIEAAKEKRNKTVITEKMRCKSYYQSFALLWGAAAAIFFMCLIGGISPYDIGFKAMGFTYNIWLTVITLVLCGLAAVNFLYQLILSLVSEKYRKKAQSQISSGEGAGKVLPRSKREKRLFAFLCFSAGTCEEVIYRGFFAFLLQAVFPGIPVYLIILIPSVLFGLGHFYQGVKGVIMTGVTGAVLMCLYLVSGSLTLCMALHFLMDFSSTFLLSEEQAESAHIF